MGTINCRFTLHLPHGDHLESNTYYLRVPITDNIDDSSYLLEHRFSHMDYRQLKLIKVTKFDWYVDDSYDEHGEKSPLDSDERYIGLDDNDINWFFDALKFTYRYRGEFLKDLSRSVPVAMSFSGGEEFPERDPESPIDSSDMHEDKQSVFKLIAGLIFSDTHKKTSYFDTAFKNGRRWARILECDRQTRLHEKLTGISKKGGSS